MKKFIVLLIISLAIVGKLRSQEKYGRTLNAGIGVGYYGLSPALNLNYEFDVFDNFTLAPFISVMTRRDYRYWGDNYYPYRNYYYRETIIPVGVKGCYYFDELLNAGDRWDFYAGISLGVAFRTVHWENGYYGGNDYIASRYSSPLYGNFHLGTEYKMTQKTGLFLDLSTGMSTLGLGFHF
jgi:hypothetical protein